MPAPRFDVERWTFSAFAPCAPFTPRAAFTMVELLMAMAVMVIISGAVAGLASAVYTNNDYSQGVANATQHGRVALERISQMVRSASACETFPGCAVVPVFADAYQVTDTLVVWHPAGAPANAAGPPLACEIIIYSPDPSDPRRLVEITPAKSDTRLMPLPTVDYVGWRAFIDGLKKSTQSTKTELTDLLRVASVKSSMPLPGFGTGTELRGVVQFDCQATPSTTDFSAYRMGTTAWSALPWPQGLYGSQIGVRQTRVTMELQLMLRPTGVGQVSSGNLAIPMLGSAVLNSELSK